MSSGERRAAFTSSSVPESYQRVLAPVIFEPWARKLLDLAGVGPGQAVLDVATGTGVVARLAARAVGAEGRVVASDVSAAMLAVAGAQAAEPGAAPIELLESPVTELRVADGAFDVVLCQQGLPFFTDRPAAAREMRRVLRRGGVAAVAVWTAGRRLEPFADYNEALEAHGVEPPFPGAYDGGSYVMAPEEVEALLDGAGFSDVDVRTVELEVEWPDAEAAAAGIHGTPFGPLVAGLPEDRGSALLADVARRFGEAPVRRTTAAVLGRAVA